MSQLQLSDRVQIKIACGADQSVAEATDADWEEEGCMKNQMNKKQIEQSTLQVRRAFGSSAFRSAMFAVALITVAVVQGNAQTDGIMMVQNLTAPRGGVWLSNSTPAT